ncbi:hypothetical protein ABIE67_000312 [Streptomyces sp. V4I8]|uniref:hypothetical protein n=1 Tax=Streptomyces sp. V4I8 TaxID=3156469 RepID=UPI003515FCE2
MHDDYLHDAVQAALRELAHDHNRASPLAGISAIASSAHRINRGTPEDTDTRLAATTPNGLSAKPNHLEGAQGAAASEAAVRMDQLVAQDDAITAVLASADQARCRERLIEDVPARITRDAQHLMNVTVWTERMIFLLHESQRSDIEHGDHH